MAKLSDMWLYQMSDEVWPEAQFRAAVWEGTTIYWPIGLVRDTDARPVPGERVVCWYAPTGSELPGLVGWGVVLGFSEARDELVWRPSPPTDAVKMCPIFDDDLKEHVDNVRGGFPRATMWPVTVTEARYLAHRIRTWGSSPAS
jgi:hypothetical protein